MTVSCAESGRPRETGSRIAVVDGDPVFRSGLNLILRRWKRVHLAASASNVAEALILARSGHVDILVLCLAMPATTIAEVIGRVAHERSEVRVVVVSASEEGGHIRAVLQAGASAFVSHRTVGQDLVPAIEAVRRGTTFVSPGLSAHVTGQEQTRSPAPSTVAHTSPPLTPREVQIVERIELGSTNDQIAQDLGISGKTVKNHVSDILSKLHARSRVEAVLKFQSVRHPT